MALKGPTTEDKQKIHQEVNQIVNQRLVLTALGVTIFGVMIAWLIPNHFPSQPEPLGGFIFVASSLLTIVLFALFLLNHHLTYMLRIFTTYLAETDNSGWESDWIVYRKEYGYLGYTKPQSLIFILLGFIASSFPYFLWAAYSFTLEPKGGILLNIIIGVLYIVFVFGMGFCSWFTKEKDMKAKWSELNNDTKKEV